MVEQQQALATNYYEIRSFAYDLLRCFFLEEPRKDLLRSLQSLDMNNFPFVRDSTLIKEGVDEVSTFFHQYDIDTVFDELHWDYTRMFIGPYEIPAPIWESAYLNKDRLLFQEETLKVRLAYLKYNFLPKNFGNEADDHLGLELDFLFQLNLLTMKAEDEQCKKELILDQINFLENHLLKWVPLLKGNILSCAKFDFYKGMVKILQGFLEIDKSCLEDLLTIKN